MNESLWYAATQAPSRLRARIGARPTLTAASRRTILASSTPDALWGSPSLRLLRPAAVRCAEVTRGPHLSRCSLAVPVGTRLLLVSDPHESASVLLRVLAGLSRARSGTVEIAGLRDGWERRVAYLGPDPGLHAWMTPREVLDLAADLLGLRGNEAAQRLERVVAWVHLRPADMERPMSRGGVPVLQRVGLAAALIGDPEVLLLDEPLAALDEDDRTRLLGPPGPRRTVLLASRYPARDAAFASHVALIRAGRVALLAAIREITDAGLPVSMRGIEELADRRAAEVGSRARPGRSVSAL